MFGCLLLMSGNHCGMQVEVSSSKYIAHLTSRQQQVAALHHLEGASAAPAPEQLMSQLAELDKLGQEGAAPVNDAEVQLPDCLLTNASRLLSERDALISLSFLVVTTMSHSWHRQLDMQLIARAGTKD